MTGRAFDGAVLCGGASRRMGRDKATIVIDGVPLFRRVLDAMVGAGAVTATTIGGSAAVAEAGTHVADRWPGEGPLGGVITALGAPGQTSLVAVASCDLLRPDAAAFASLMEGRAATDADVAVAVAAGVEQWTTALWHRRVAEVLAERFDGGERAIRRAVDTLDVARVAVDVVAAADADSPEDLPGAASGRTFGT